MFHLKSRREFLKLSAATGTSLFLAACAAAVPTGDSPAGEEAAIEVSAWFTDRRTINAMTEEVLANEFNAQNPNINVDLQFVPGSEVLTKLQAAHAASQAPDLAAIDEEMMPALVPQGILHGIPEEIIDVRVEMGERVADFYRFPDSNYYALPNGNMCSCLYYNIDLLEENGYTPEDIPANWTDFVTWAEELTVWEGDDLVQTGFSFNGDGIWLADAIRFQNGGWWFIDDKTCAWTEPETAQAYQFVLDLFDVHRLQDRLGLPSVDQFTQGKAVTSYFWTWRQGFFLTEFPDINFGTLPNPSHSGEGPYGRASEDLGFSISSQSDDNNVIDASWTLWRYLVGPDYQRRYVRFRGVQPSLKVLWDEEEFSTDDQSWKGLAITTTPGHFISPGVWPSEISDELTRSWTRVRDEGESIEVALAEACAEVEEILGRREEWPLIIGKNRWEANPQWQTER